MSTSFESRRTDPSPTPSVPELRGALDAAVGSASHRAHRDATCPGMPQLVATELRRHEACALDHDGGHAGLCSDRSHAIAGDRERGLVDNEDRVDVAQPLIDQKRFHFVTLTRVPSPPTFESSSNSSTRRLLPDRPSPIDRAVE